MTHYRRAAEFWNDSNTTTITDSNAVARARSHAVRCQCFTWRVLAPLTAALAPSRLATCLPPPAASRQPAAARSGRSAAVPATRPAVVTAWQTSDERGDLGDCQDDLILLLGTAAAP